MDVTNIGCEWERTFFSFFNGLIKLNFTCGGRQIKRRLILSLGGVVMDACEAALVFL